MVEQCPFKALVEGSSPSQPNFYEQTLGKGDHGAFFKNKDSLLFDEYF